VNYYGYPKLNFIGGKKNTLPFKKGVLAWAMSAEVDSNERFLVRE
jgi:hypothetical protein